MHRVRLAAAIALASWAAGCAIAPAATEQELAMREALTAREILPQSRAQRAAMADAPLVAQAAFWAAEYEKNPADREAAAEFARTSRLMGQPARAIDAANRALALYPDDPALLVALGAALVADGRAAAAVGPLERAIALEPRHPGASTVLGTALDHLGRHADAQAAYARAVETAGETPTILANLGLSHILAGDPANGVEVLRRAASLPGADVRVRQNLALALALDGRFEEAEALAQQDLDRDRARESVDYVRRILARDPGAAAAALGIAPQTSQPRLEILTPKPAGTVIETPAPPPLLRPTDGDAAPAATFHNIAAGTSAPAPSAQRRTHATDIPAAPGLRTAEIGTPPPSTPAISARPAGPMLADLAPSLRSEDSSADLVMPLEIGGPEEPEDLAAPPVLQSPALRLRR